MAELQQELFTGTGVPDGTVAVNARCLVRTEAGHRVVLVAGIVLCQYSAGDAMAEAHAMVSLVVATGPREHHFHRNHRCP